MAWKALQLGTLSSAQGSMMTASNVHEEDRTWVEYAWIKGRKGPNVERRWYTEQHQLKNKAQGGNKFRAVTMYGIRQTRGPYCCEDPRYLDIWWEWVSGSTLLFWNWPKKY